MFHANVREIAFIWQSMESVYAAFHNAQSEASLSLIEFQNLLLEIEFAIQQEFLRDQKMRRNQRCFDSFSFLVFQFNFFSSFF